MTQGQEGARAEGLVGESLLRLMADSLPAAVAYADRDLRFVFCNRRYAETYFPPGEPHEGRPLSEMIDPELLARRQPIFERVFQGEAVRFQAPSKTRDGQWIECDISYVPDVRGGQVCGFVAMIQDISPLRRVADALAESERRFRTVIASMVEGVLVADRNGLIHVVNDAFLRMVGFDKETPCLKLEDVYDAFELLDAEGKPVPRNRRPAARALGGETVRDWVGRGINLASRKEFVGAYGAVPIFVDGEVDRVIVTIHDVTGVVETQQALRRNEESLRRFIDGANEGIIRFGPDDRVVFSNEFHARLLGYEPGETAGMHVLEFVFPEELERAAERRRERRAGLSERYEARVRGKHGQEVWVVNSTVVVFDGDRYDGTYSMLTDITELKRAERALRRSEERFRFLAELGDELRRASDAEALIRLTVERLGHHLRAARCTFGDFTETGLVIREAWLDGLPACPGLYQLEAFGEDVAAMIERGETVTLEDSTHHQGFASLGIGAVVCRPLVANGQLVAIVSVQSAVPRRWEEDEVELIEQVAERAWASIRRTRAEEELRRLNAELEQRVEQRTQELREAVRELEGFTYSVSHDLRAPLRAINATSAILLEEHTGGLGEEGLRLLQRQGIASAKVGHLVDDLLKLSRISREDMAVAQIDLTRLAREVEMELRERPWGNPPVVEISEGLVARGDERLLRLMLENLFGNAFKFSPQGGTVRFGRTEDGAFYLQDEGIGFDMRYLDKLWTPFERLHRDDEVPGTGIGLANVKRIVERHGGTVWAEGEVGRGATFWFRLCR